MMSDNWTPEELLGYCETHCKTERALFHSKHINRVVTLAGLGEQNHVREGWYSVHDEMQDLVDRARAAAVAATQDDNCPQCKKPWVDHEFGVPAPFCP